MSPESAPDIASILEEEFQSLINERKPRPKTNGVGKVSPLRLRGAMTIYKTEYEPPAFVIDDLLPRGLTIVAGRPKVGKSWLTLQLAVAVAHGETALGRFRVRIPGTVMYLALEEPEHRTHHRLHQLVSQEDARMQNIQFVYDIQPLMTGGAIQLDQALAGNSTDLLIVDTVMALTAAHSARKDVVRGDYSEIATLRQLAEKHKTAILAVHHTRKAAGDVVDTVIGTSGTTAACDSIWRIKSTGTREASLEVKGRELEEAVYGLAFATGEAFGWRVTGEGEEVGMSEQRREIMLVLEQEGAKRPAEIARLLGNKNVNTTRRLVQKLAHQGLIRQQQNGTYIPVSQSGVNG